MAHMDRRTPLGGRVGLRSLPKDAGKDNFSILPTLLGEKQEQPLCKATVHHALGGTFANRSGNWKLVTNNLGFAGASRRQCLSYLLELPPA